MVAVISSSGDGGNDSDLVSIRRRGVEPPDEPDVFIVKVEGNERVGGPLRVFETREQLGVAGDEIVDRTADGRPVGFYGPRAADVRGKDGREMESDGHLVGSR